MHARALGTFVLLAGALCGETCAGAQTVATVEHIMIEMSSQTTELDSALSKLGSLSTGLRGTDAHSAELVMNAGRQFSSAAGEATPVGLILRHMKSAEDARFTRAMLAISASKALMIADSDIEIITRELPKIAAPAAAAESVKIRDAIVLSRNLLQTFALTAKASARAQPPST